MPNLKECVVCGKQIDLDDKSTFMTLMDGVMHRYVCSNKCMFDFYNSPSKPQSAPSDTDRLNFILSHFAIDDIGDEWFVPGVVISHEELEMKLTFGKFAKDRYPALVSSLDDDLRTVIDKAIAAHGNEVNHG